MHLLLAFMLFASQAPSDVVVKEEIIADMEIEPFSLDEIALNDADEELLEVVE